MAIFRILRYVSGWSWSIVRNVSCAYSTFRKIRTYTLTYAILAYAYPRAMVLCFSDPKCGVVGIPIRGENVTLSCAMTYRRLPINAAVIPGAGFSASVSWDAAAGTPLRSSSTELGSTVVIGETLEVDVLTFAGGTEIPSYNCTTEFNFTDKQDPDSSYAHNDLSWTCVSAPVFTWCTYFKLLHCVPKSSTPNSWR